MPNRLAQEKSPYLLQHAENPVDWLPWGEEAFELAEREQRPVFLSIGYATCHWCHVMAHESFEDPEVADFLNRNFVPIKVDREERPDVDSVYMKVCQALTGSGGWPLSVFLTPGKKPFYAGTYFPKTPAFGRPGFLDLLRQIDHIWRREPNKALDSGEKITQALRQYSPEEKAEMGEHTLEKAYWSLTRSYDQRYGGFGRAPKFPTPHNLTFLLRWHARNGDGRALEMASRSLKAMRRGGIFDQVGLGFHRYSVDERWLVPHFEKMLYDQALLATAYLEAFQASGDGLFADAAREIFTYLERDMTHPEGALYSAEDADTQGEEGLYYVWSPDELKGALGDELAALFCSFYDIGPQGNFEHGRSVAWVRRPEAEFAKMRGLDEKKLGADLKRARELAFAAREKRPRPQKDDKVLTAWNGLAVSALAKGARVLGDMDYYKAAERAADFLALRLMDDNGRPLRRWREGHALGPGYLDDYAFWVQGLLDLYESGFDPRHLEEGLRLSGLMLELFWDDLRHGFFYTPHHAEELIVREKEYYDGATPSGNSVAALNLLRLSRLTGDPRWERRAQKLLESVSGQASAQPMAHTMLLQALDYALGPGCEVVIAGVMESQAVQGMLRALWGKYTPNLALLVKEPNEKGERLSQLAPFTAEMAAPAKGALAYVCRGHACQRPVETVGELMEALS